MRKTGICLIIFFVAVAMLFVSCGNKEKEDEGISIYETRQPVEAIENKDYRIDNIVVALADSPDQNGNVQYISFDEFKSVLQTRKASGEPVYCKVTIRYTALKELSRMECRLNINFWSFTGGQNLNSYGDVDGNSDLSKLLVTGNVLPGEHYLSFSIEILNQEEGTGTNVIENFDSIDDKIQFKAQVYAYTN